MNCTTEPRRLHPSQVPIVAREDYTLVDLNDEGFVSSPTLHFLAPFHCPQYP